MHVIKHRLYTIADLRDSVLVYANSHKVRGFEAFLCREDYYYPLDTRNSNSTLEFMLLQNTY